MAILASKKMKLKEWNPDDMPREKMLRYGPAFLSNSELLAILLRTGSSRMNVVDTARILLQSADNKLVRLSEMTVDTMMRVNGIGQGKALMVAAAFELGQRLGFEKKESAVYIRNAADARDVLGRLYTTSAREECWCLFLKRSRKLIGSVRISEGGESMTEINIKQIVRRALDMSAAAILISHNHPGGDPRPSLADIKLTKQLRQALEMFELALTDHIIISEGICYSFSMESTF